MPSATKKNFDKHAWRRAKKKEKRSEARSEVGDSARESETPAPDNTSNDSQAAQPVDTMDVDDIAADLDPSDPAFAQFKNIFDRFKQPAAEETVQAEEKPEIFYEDDDIPEEDDDGKPKISKKQRKLMNKMTVAQLKSRVKRPELVEWTDVSSSDPELLVAIKGKKNVVPVPSHWSLKREYLSSKRGIEKPPFMLPKFIQETGISEMRDAVLEKQAEMSLRQKQRERVQGKLGKLDIDYAKLYDAFFRRQTKPDLTGYGEVYYEGKEFETNLVNLKPGEISEELREALGMAPGHPPPWLINMQRSGPPSSYPSLLEPLGAFNPDSGVSLQPMTLASRFLEGTYMELQSWKTSISQLTSVSPLIVPSGALFALKGRVRTRRVMRKRKMKTRMRKMATGMHLDTRHQWALHQQCLQKSEVSRALGASSHCVSNVAESRQKSQVRLAVPSRSYLRRIFQPQDSSAASMRTILMRPGATPLGSNGSAKLAKLMFLLIWISWLRATSSTKMLLGRNTSPKKGLKPRVSGRVSIKMIWRI